MTDPTGSTPPPRVTIGVNLTWLVPGVVGGSEEYAVRLLGAVGDHLPPGVTLRLYGRRDLFDAHPELAARHRVRRVPTDHPSRAIRVGLEQTWLAAAGRHDVAMHHLGGTVPFVRTAPAVVTIHDLQPLDHPEHFHPIKRRWLAFALPHAARTARLVLCPSAATAERVRIRLGVAPSRLRVVPHGHDAPPDPDFDGHLGSGESWPVPAAPYLLYPAIAYRHKRHVDVVRALDRLAHRHPRLDVVFTGRPGPETATVAAEAARLGLADRVHVLGRVPRDHLHALYRSATALVFPSAYEGFGNPALEAMHAGCLVIASDAGALPEVIGDAGLLVPVGDDGALATAVAKLLDAPDLAADLRRRGHARARRFSTAIAARRLAAVYGELVGRPTD